MDCSISNLLCQYVELIANNKQIVTCAHVELVI